MGAWVPEFDRSWPEPGATAEQLRELEASVRAPLSDGELRRLDRDRNTLPSDPGGWRLPTETLPDSYLRLLAWSNGGEFWTGERCFQFLAAADVRTAMLEHRIPAYLPGMVPIGLNGGGTFYLLDLDHRVDGEAPIVCAAAGDLGTDPDQCWRIATSLPEACGGSTDVDDLRPG